MATSTIKVNSIMGGANVTSEVKAIACKYTYTAQQGNTLGMNLSDLTNGVLTSTDRIVGVSAYVDNCINSIGAVVAGARKAQSGTDRLILHMYGDTASSYTLNLRIVIFYT